jgi:D-serine ammonia-lyase
MNPTFQELKEKLRREYVGKTLLEVATPAALLDLSKIKRNCARMLEDVDTLEFGWRPHIKTHKVPP